MRDRSRDELDARVAREQVAISQAAQDDAADEIERERNHALDMARAGNGRPSAVHGPVISMLGAGLSLDRGVLRINAPELQKAVLAEVDRAWYLPTVRRRDIRNAVCRGFNDALAIRLAGEEDVA